MKPRVNIHFLFVLIAAMLWGTAGIFVRAIENTDISEMQIVLARTVFSSIILAVIILIKDKSLFKIKLKDLWLFACGGVLSIVLFNYSYYKTMALISLSVAAVLLYTAPFFVVIISRFLFGDKLTVKKCVALVTAFIGCAMVSGMFDASHRISPPALAFGLLTGLGYSLYTIFGELILRRGYNTLTLTFYVFLSAAIGTLPFINPAKTFVEYAANINAVAIMFLMAVFNTVLPYIFYTAGLKGVEPSVAPIIATVEPVVATLVGTFIFKEEITLWGIIGILVVLASVGLLNMNFFKKDEITAYANAKINLGLDICGKREDGYHFIDTVMQSVTLRDKVTVKKADKITVKCNIGDIDNENNIAFKAAELFFEASKILGGAEIYIEKNIPMAAGVGGGSADGAAVLLALCRLYRADLSDEKLSEIALKLGADVPFFIKGGTSRSQGIGEILTELKPFTSGYFLLVKQGDKPSTGEMYARLDSENPPHPDMEATVKAIENDDLSAFVWSVGNSFISVNKEFVLKDRLLEMGALGVSLSGSGPTWYAVFDDKAKAETAEGFLKRSKIECFLVTPCDKAVIFE